MKVKELQAMLTQLQLEAKLDGDYDVAVWVADHGGEEARDLKFKQPIIDQTENFVAFYLSPSI